MYRIAIVPSSDCLLCSAASSSALDFACNARSASCNPKACCSWLKERALHFSSCNTIAMSTTRQLQMGNSSNNAVPWHQNGCETPLQTADVKLLTAHGIVAVSFESAFQSHLSRCTCGIPADKVSSNILLRRHVARHKPPGTELLQLDASNRHFANSRPATSCSATLTTLSQ